MGRFFKDISLPGDIVYYILSSIEKESIILNSESIRITLKKEGYIVSNSWAAWRLKKSLNIVPNGWVAESWTNGNGGLRVRYTRIGRYKNE